MARYAGKLSHDIDRWVERGLIDEATAQALRRDAEQEHRSSISLGTVLAVMAAVLVCAAILILIAANIDEIPRIVRVLGLFAIIAVSYLGGAALKARGSAGIGEALYLVGLAAFGASIALIGQMYHMSGDEAQAIMIWCLGGILAAVLLKSPILTNASVLIACAWLLMAFDWGRIDHGPSYIFLVLMAVIWAISYWTESRVARHLVILAVLFYALLYAISDDAIAVGILLIALSIAVFAAAYIAPDFVERFAKLGGPQPIHPLIAFLLGVGLLQAQFANDFGPISGAFAHCLCRHCHRFGFARARKPADAMDRLSRLHSGTHAALFHDHWLDGRYRRAVSLLRFRARGGGVCHFAH